MGNKSIEVELVNANKELLFQNEVKGKRVAELDAMNAELLLARIRLSESEEWYRSLFQSNQSIMILIDPLTGNLKDANTAACKYYGWSLSEMLEKNISEINTLTKEEVSAEMMNAVQQKRKHFYFKHRLASGAIRDVEVNAGPVVVGENTYLYSIILDITDRLKTAEDLKRSEEKFRFLIQNSNDIIFSATAEGVFTFVSDAWTILLGHPIHDVVGKSFQQFIHPDDLKMYMDYLIKQIEMGKRQLHVEYRVQHIDGSWRWHSSAVSLMYENNSFKTFEGVARDVTERKLAEKSLRESKEIFTQFLNHSPVYVFIKDDGMRALQLSTNYEKMLGKPLQDLIGKTTDELFPSELSKNMQADDLQTLHEGKQIQIEEEFNGRHYTTIKFPITIEGKREYLAGFTIDVTERKLSEERLKDSENKYRLLVENSPDIVYAFSDKSGGIYYSPRVEQVLGYSPEYLYEHPYLWNSSIHHDDLAAVENAIRESTAGKLFEVEYRIKDIHGNWRWLLDRSIKRNNLHGETMIEGMARDITDRKHSEELIKTSEFKFRTVADYAYDWEYWLGEDQQIIFMSPSCERITGYTTEEFIADPALVQKIVHPDDAETFNHHHDTSFSFDLQSDNDECEFKIYHRNGMIVNILHNCRPIYDENGRFLGRRISNKDITERKKTEVKMLKSEKRLQQSEKMEAIGQLAGGIAHDFNNILTGIIGYTGMSQRHAENNPVLKKNLIKILAASDRAKHLVQQILSFSRQSSQQKVVMPLTPIVKEVLDLLKASIPSSVAIESDLQIYVKPVLADSTKIHEVLLNLATNAVQAMKQKGTLTVRLSNAFLRQTEYLRTGELAPGEYSVIEVTDTGCGMNLQTMERAFEPFFTTKGVGEGTGMGLSVVLGIVQQHGGNIHVESVEGKGTTFRIYLPASLTSVSDSGQKKPENTVFGSERILFVDDEQMLVDMAENELTYLGYSVVCKSNGRDALEFLKNDASCIDILITDQTMPGLTGIELAQEALKIRQDLPVILCTGFSSQVNSENAKAKGIQHFVLKPYDINEISQLIRKMIDQKNGK